MNRKITGTILALAMLIPLVLIAPAMAAPNANAYHTVPAYQTSNLKVTYAQLTDYCINVWGLSENPYPAYPADIKTAYYIFTFMIGDDEYQGISVNTYTQTINPKTGLIDQTYNAIWYVGDWGVTNARMNQGFSGTVNVQVPYPWTNGFSAQFNLEGFQRFNHQTLMLTIANSKDSPLATGFCDVLGNRDKM
jgi:hypothetical protein